MGGISRCVNEILANFMKKAVIKIIGGDRFGKDPAYKLISKHLDKAFYLSTNPDVRASGIDPVRHYIAHGHAEGRDPTPDFSTSGYLARYPDVVSAGLNAFHHYLQHGRHENRTGAPVEVIHSGAGPAEIVLAPTHGVAGKGEPQPLAALLPRLDEAKVARLLGGGATTMMARPLRIGMTHVLERRTAVAANGMDEADGAKGRGKVALVAADGLGPDAATTAATAAAEDGVPDGAELAAQMLAAAQGKTLSLDLWDTILRRDCSPDAIKLRHARVQWLTRIDPEGDLADLHPIDLFHLRRMAEADVADEHFEYRIDEVATRMAPLLAEPGEDFAAGFIDREIALEKAAISIDPVAAQLIAGHEGRKLILSDFYMPGTALEALLDHVGLDAIDKVYSSSDHMATKRAGALYDLVLAAEGLDCRDVLHMGDRFSADVAAARNRGIAAFHYYSPSHQPRLEKLDRDFWSHVTGDASAHATAIAEALGHEDGADPELEMLSVAATGFVLHVMEEALRRKVDKVFFFTREGDFFRRIYEVLAARDVFELGTYPQPVVIEVSRRATFAASMDDFTIDELMRLWSQYSAQSVAALATTLNVDLEQWSGVAARLGLDVDEKVELPWRDPRFVAFVRNPKVARVARAAILEQRGALLEYLEAAGYEPRADLQRVIVDIGWRGTIQDNLARISSGRLHGCYFGLEHYLNPQAANVSKSGYVFDANRRYPLRVSEVAGLEFLFNAPGGSTTGYREGVALREIVPEEEGVVTGPVAAMQERLLAATATIGDYVRRHGIVSSDLVSFAREVVADFAQTPPVEVAEAFFRLSHNESFGVGSVHSMGFDASGLDGIARLDGSRLHGEVSRRLKGLRWAVAAHRLPAFRALEERLAPSQRIHVPVAPALVRPGSLGQPRLAVLSPAPIRGSGGHRTIYNFAASLARRGYDVDLMHERPADAATAEWIGSVLGDVSLTQHSAWVNWLHPTASAATIWYSQRYAAQYWDDARQFYFVQDYEAMFNPVGDTYLHAAQSYSWGAQHICVGRWLAHNLRAQFGVGVASGGLGVDHKVYRPLDEDEEAGTGHGSASGAGASGGTLSTAPRRRDNQIALLYQPEKFRRAPQLCVEALEIVKAQMPDTRIVLYGSDQKPHLPFEHEHLGLITDVNRINTLYAQSAAGLCISATNPSRIPFEMMAAGCVPVDIYRYNNLFDYDAGTGVLAHESAESIAEALLGLLRDPAAREARSARCMDSVIDRSLEWEMDAAVNAVDMGMSGFDFDDLAPVRPTYTDAPVIAGKWDTAPVNRFMEYQWEQAGGGERDGVKIAPRNGMEQVNPLKNGAKQNDKALQA